MSSEYKMVLFYALLSSHGVEFQSNLGRISKHLEEFGRICNARAHGNG